jgi:hypothetical protein
MTFDHIEQAEVMRSLRLKVQELEKSLEAAREENQVYYEMQYNLIMNLMGEPDIVDLIEELQTTPYVLDIEKGQAIHGVRRD